MTTLTLAEVLDKVALPVHQLVSALPFSAVGFCFAAVVGAKHQGRVALWIVLGVPLAAHLLFHLIVPYIDADIAVAAANEYRRANSRDYRVDMQMAALGSLLVTPIFAFLGFKLGRSIAQAHSAPQHQSA